MTIEEDDLNFLNRGKFFVVGTRDYAMPEADVPSRTQGVPVIDADCLVRLWLEEDSEDEDLVSRWVIYANQFLETISYPKHEHKDLLCRAFTRYLQGHNLF